MYAGFFEVPIWKLADIPQAGLRRIDTKLQCFAVKDFEWYVKYAFL